MIVYEKTKSNGTRSVIIENSEQYRYINAYIKTYSHKLE